MRSDAKSLSGRCGRTGALALGGVLAAAGPAAAQDLAGGLQRLLDMLGGPFILALATLAILGVGILFSMGRMHLNTAMTVVIGIVIAGSAASLAAKLVGS